MGSTGHESRDKDDQGLNFSGHEFGGRFDVTRQIGESWIELGGRTGFSFADLDLDNGPTGVGGSVEAMQFVLAPIVRAHLAEPDVKVRPYIEAGVGWQHASVDVSASSGVFTQTASESDDGVWYMLGGGVQIKGSGDTDWFVGFTYERSELSDLEADTDFYGALVGARIRF